MMRSPKRDWCYVIEGEFDRLRFKAVVSGDPKYPTVESIEVNSSVKTYPHFSPISQSLTALPKHIHGVHAAKVASDIREDTGVWVYIDAKKGRVPIREASLMDEGKIFIEMDGESYPFVDKEFVGLLNKSVKNETIEPLILAGNGKTAVYLDKSLNVIGIITDNYRTPWS